LVRQAGLAFVDLWEGIVKSKRDIFNEEYELHLSTWGPNCGAPLDVYKGHLDVLLKAARELAEEKIEAMYER
jgi:hypothetical protein